MRWGCFRWGVREDFSEEAAFELRAKGSEGVGHGATGGKRVLCTQRASAKAGDRSEPDVPRSDRRMARAAGARGSWEER